MISVIIPTLDEGHEIGGAVEDLTASDGVDREIIVVDGGSCDDTASVATTAGAIVVTSPAGRGRQMNAGAAVAGGEILLFLHADTRLPAGGLEAVTAVMSDPDVPGGGFLKRYDRAGPLLGVTAWILNTWRTRLLRSLVGTQAIFVRRSVFQQLGGYREWPLLEDVDLSDRLRRIGRPAVVPLAVTASARRYRRRGTLRQVLVNGMILGLFRLGVDAERLRRIYEGIR